MLFSKFYIPTCKDHPLEEGCKTQDLMSRAGLIRKLGAGIYAYLPLGLRAIKNIENVIRQEMELVFATELLMPSLLPAELYEKSGRLDLLGTDLFRLKDRHNRDFCLGPTYEEAFSHLIKNDLRHTQELPLILYQFHAKYRDEQPPRYGIHRAREFLMKDAYSFDADEKGLEDSYQKMKQAYCNILHRLGIDFLILDADAGTMAGFFSEAFVIQSADGDTPLAVCPNCNFIGNIQKAPCAPPEEAMTSAMPSYPIKVYTPRIKSVEDTAKFFNVSPQKIVKTLIYRVDTSYVAVCVRGDREVNETKLKDFLSCISVRLADSEAVKRLTGASVGYAGPMGLKGVSQIIIDQEVSVMEDAIMGANETDYHFKNILPGRDFERTQITDLRQINAGDTCPHCLEGKIIIKKCMELGHIFKLGTYYSHRLNCWVSESQDNKIPLQMGSYGLGIGRILSAIIAQNHDAAGMLWPMIIAPFKVYILPVYLEKEAPYAYALDLYATLRKMNIAVLIDDRPIKPASKFKDADLIGIPIRITIGKNFSDGKVELKLRHNQTLLEVPPSEVIQKVMTLIDEMSKTS